MTDVLSLIDGAISDWETSPDAMRWGSAPHKEVPEPPDAEAGRVQPPDELDRIDVMASWMGDDQPRGPRVFKGVPSWNPAPPALPRGWVALANIRVPGTSRTGGRDDDHIFHRPDPRRRPR